MSQYYRKRWVRTWRNKNGAGGNRIARRYGWGGGDRKCIGPPLRALMDAVNIANSSGTAGNDTKRVYTAGPRESRPRNAITTSLNCYGLRKKLADGMPLCAPQHSPHPNTYVPHEMQLTLDIVRSMKYELITNAILNSFSRTRQNLLRVV